MLKCRYYRSLLYKYNELLVSFLSFNGNVGIIDEFFFVGPSFYLLQWKAGTQVTRAPVSFFLFLRRSCFMRFTLFSTFLLLLYSIWILFFYFFSFCITLRVYIKLFHYYHYSYQCSSNWSCRVISRLCLLRFVFSIKSSIFQKENHLSLRKSVKRHFTLKFII